MHLRPAALRAHAATAAGLVDELDALRMPDAAVPGAGELAAAVVRARRELDAVRDVLLAVAVATEEADTRAADALRAATSGPAAAIGVPDAGSGGVDDRPGRWPGDPAGAPDPSWVAELGGSAGRP